MRMATGFKNLCLIGWALIGSGCNFVLDLDPVRDGTGIQAGGFAGHIATSSTFGGAANSSGGVSAPGLSAGGVVVSSTTSSLVAGGSLSTGAGGVNLAGGAQPSAGQSAASGGDGGQSAASGGFAGSAGQNGAGGSSGHENGGSSATGGGAAPLGCGDPMPRSAFPLVLTSSASPRLPAGGSVTEGLYALTNVTIYGDYYSVPWGAIELRGGYVHRRYVNYTPEGEARAGDEQVGQYAIVGAAMALSVKSCQWGMDSQVLLKFTSTPTEIEIFETQSSTTWIQKYTLQP